MARKNSSNEKNNLSMEEQFYRFRRVEIALRERNAQLNSMIEATAAITSSLDLDEVLNTILRSLNQVVPCDSASIFLENGDKLRLVFGMHFPKNQSTDVDFYLSNENLLYQDLLRTHQPIILVDAQTHPHFVLCKGFEDVHGWIGIPLIIDDRVLGFMTVDHHVVGAYTENEAHLAQALANQAAIAIENARLYEALEERLKELNALIHTSEIINSVHDLNQVLIAVMDDACLLIHASAAGVLLHDPDRRELVYAVKSGSVPDHIVGTRVPDDVGIAGLVFQNRESLLVPDVQNDPRYNRKINSIIGNVIDSVVAAPLVYKQKAIGVFLAVNGPENGFNEHDLELLTILSGLAAISIENARLYESVYKELRERWRAEAELAHQAARAEALARVTTRINAYTSLTPILNSLAKETAHTLNLSIVAIRLYDKNTDTLVPAAQTGYPESAISELLSIPGSLIDRLSREQGNLGGVYAIESIPDPELRDRFRGMGALLWAFAPMVHENEFIGILTGLSHREADSFTKDEIFLLHAFASQGAIAIAHARLFDQMQAGKKRLEVLSHQLVEAQEAERRRLAYELHDHVGQTLTGLQLVLRSGAHLSITELRSEVKIARGIVKDLISEVRELSVNLRPALLDDLGLLPTLEWLFQRYQELTGIHVEASLIGLDRRFSAEIEISAFRIIQEALTNVARHAGVNQVDVHVKADENLLSIVVEDHGKGFEIGKGDEHSISFGLSSMRERSMLVGGKMEIQSQLGKGTRIEVSLPI